MAIYGYMDIDSRLLVMFYEIISRTYFTVIFIAFLHYDNVPRMDDYILIILIILHELLNLHSYLYLLLN